MCERGHFALARAVLALAGSGAALLDHAAHPWASITFTGAKHNMRLRFTGLAAIAAAELFVAELPGHEFAVRDQLVADASVVRVAKHHAIDPPFVEVEAELLVLQED